MKRISRRTLITGAAGAVGAALVHTAAHAGVQQTAPPPVPLPTNGGDPRTVPGRPPSELGTRAPGEQPQRLVNQRFPSGSSRTPLQDLHGIITPSDLHFERHHGGVPAIAALDYKLLIHGMVDRPMVFSLADLKRYPSRSQICFIECSGNGGAAYRGLRAASTPQEIDGLTSTSEWVGVPLATLFREVGVQRGAKWFLAESTDAAAMSRSIPIEKGWDDAMIAYGQNGEAIRPEQGYPARLMLPGWEGNAQVKWLRRIDVSDRPFMTRDETSKYSDPLPDCTARLFSFDMDAKSIITFPAYPAILPERGWWEITGLAWSGRGEITRVDVSTDGGRSWTMAELAEPVLPKCHTRFRFLWNWNGAPAVLMSRAKDETGYVQPTLERLKAVRGAGTQYHFNNIRAWRVEADGQVAFGLEG
jgi:sulfane dehydrogenase subunit SoxC